LQQYDLLMKNMLLCFLHPSAQVPPDFTEADPWSHPALARMTLRELADLPFPREPDISRSEGPAGICRSGEGHHD
jgi:hypothetical protein